MNYTNKPLTFEQELKVQKYLFIRQEMISVPEQQENPEVWNALDEASQEISKFLTMEEVEELEQNSLLYPEDEQPQETIEFSLLLPPGWKAEDYEVGEPDTQINKKLGYISFSCMIYEKPAYDEEENNED